MANAKIVSFWGSLLLAASLAAEPTILWEKDTTTYEYALLKRVLEVTQDRFGPMVVVAANLEITEERAVDLLQRGAIDVTAMVLTPERAHDLPYVPIDLTHGIQGYRVFLIRREDQDRFSKVNSLDALRHGFVAGFGEQWGDLEALTANALPVVAVADTRSLYLMLQAKRFDYFPRGINEVWDNLRQHQDDAPDMVVETHLALYYPLFQAYVVSPSDPDLKTRIEAGLRKLLADGSMKQIFLQFHQNDIRQAHLDRRTVLVLSNPDLPPGLPAIDTDWWLGH